MWKFEALEDKTQLLRDFLLQFYFNYRKQNKNIKLFNINNTQYIVICTFFIVYICFGGQGSYCFAPFFYYKSKGGGLSQHL